MVATGTVVDRMTDATNSTAAGGSVTDSTVTINRGAGSAEP
jgi:hypothetical protein